MINKTSSILFLLTLLQTAVFSQTPARRKLRIGDLLPPFSIVNLNSSSKSALDLAKFRGKNTVLYFCEGDCSQEIPFWPGLLQLQQRFEKNLQIVLVTPSGSQEEIRRMVKDQRKRHQVNMKLPIVHQGGEFTSLLPTQDAPQLAWIDASGKLMAITTRDELNEMNLEAFEEGRSVRLRQIEGVQYRADFSKPLFVQSNGGDGDHLQWQSVLSGYLPGPGVETWIDSCGGTLSNGPMVFMFRYLFKKQTNRFGALNLLPVSRVSLKVRDTSQYVSRSNGELQRKNFYTYQLYSRKPKSPEVIRSIMIADIKKYFGVECYWTKETKMCLVLTASDTASLMYQEGDSILAIRPTDINLNNVTFKEFLENLLAVNSHYHLGPYPLIDETAFKGKIRRIKFDAQIDDPMALNKALNAYGLQLRLQPREVDVLVIYETEFYSPPGPVEFAN